MIGVNAVAGVLYYFFYFPPTFHMKFSHRDKFQQLKDLDYVGAFLFTAGLLLFLMGLSWGGSVSYKGPDISHSILINSGLRMEICAYHFHNRHWIRSFDRLWYLGMFRAA